MCRCRGAQKRRAINLRLLSVSDYSNESVLVFAFSQ